MTIGLFVLTVLFACELFWQTHFGRTLHSILKTAKKAQNVTLSRKISDHWKEKVLLTYSGLILSTSLLLAGKFLIALSPFMLLAFIFPGGPKNLAAFSLQPLPLIASLITGLVFLNLRPRISKW